MTKLTIELPADFAMGTKVSGEFLPILPEKVDNTWLVEMLRYGAQRKINDMFAGQGAEKLEMAKAQVQAINKGEAKPEQVRRSGGATADPVRKMARNMARDLLTLAFKKKTGLAKLADMAETSDKIAAYFHITDDKITWNMQAIDAFMETKPGGRDFMAEADAALKVEVDLDF